MRRYRRQGQPREPRQPRQPGRPVGRTLGLEFKRSVGGTQRGRRPRRRLVPAGRRASQPAASRECGIGGSERIRRSRRPESTGRRRSLGGSITCSRWGFWGGGGGSIGFAPAWDIRGGVNRLTRVVVPGRPCSNARFKRRGRSCVRIPEPSRHPIQRTRRLEILGWWTCRAWRCRRPRLGALGHRVGLWAAGFGTPSRDGRRHRSRGRHGQGGRCPGRRRPAAAHAASRRRPLAHRLLDPHRARRGIRCKRRRRRGERLSDA